MPEALRRALLEWSDGEAWRDLPWRRTRDPWAVLVSELMLQQTQVARVVPKYAAFLDRFPTASACASAPVGEVVRLWAGLGYNRRAVNLHRAVRACGGVLPDTLEGLVALPGIGPYTARAVLAFAHERDVGVVDTNAARVLARTVGRSLGGREAQEVADALVPPGQGWRWNQAVLDLGATVCMRRRPRCERCPISSMCRWWTEGRPAPDPANGTAGAGRPQPSFDGSDRQGRGRIVDALRLGPVPLDRLAAVAGWSDDRRRVERVVASLVADGLAEVTEDGSQLVLP